MLEYVQRRVAPLCSIGLDPVTSDDPLLRWLDGFPERSVLYICFGSQNALTKDQSDALAFALEKSMARFVWVARGSRVGPQLASLRHVAVGWFLSLCGWNSVLEGLTSGVTVLGWPMEADQFVNARLLVEHLRVAVQACQGGETVPDPDDLGRIIAETMGARAKEIRQETVAATEAKGSSFADLERLVNEFGRL